MHTAALIEALECQGYRRGDLAGNRFRADLFHRLNGFPIVVPPLHLESEFESPLSARRRANS